MKGTETKYLKWYQKVAYGAGDLASNTSYGLVSSFVLLYLSDTMGLSTGIIGCFYQRYLMAFLISFLEL